MARRRSRSKKIEPAVKTLTFQLALGGTAYCDLSLAASVANRRFYRQGLNWAVSGVTIFAGGATNQTIGIYKIPDTWVAYNAWMKSFKLWQKMNDQVLDVEGDIDGRYSDFKIYLDVEHRDRVAASPFQDSLEVSASKTLMPCVRNSGSGALVLAGTTGLSWDPSEFVFPDPVDGTATTYHCHMVGENGTTTVAGADGSKGAILGYAYSRSRPNVTDPNVPLDNAAKAWMNDVFDYGDQNPDIREDLVTQNDTPPYAIGGDESDAEYYPGGFNQSNGLEVVVDQLVIPAGVDYSARMTLPGFNVPCGLLAIQNSGPCVVQVHLAPGPHRGYLAVPMQEF